MAPRMDADLAHPEPSQLTHRRVAKFAGQATLATERPTLTILLSSIIITVRDAPRVTTAQQAHTSLRSALPARLTQKKENPRSSTVSSASPTLSKTSGVRRAAKFAAFLLILAKEWTSASVLVITEPTLQRMPPAVARVASTTSTMTNSQREMSVTSPTASLSSSITVPSTATRWPDSLMVPVSLKMSALRHAQESLENAQKSLESVRAPTLSLWTRFATRNAERMPPRSNLSALTKS